MRTEFKEQLSKELNKAYNFKISFNDYSDNDLMVEAFHIARREHRHNYKEIQLLLKKEGIPYYRVAYK
jgi:hypothetical protein